MAQFASDAFAGSAGTAISAGTWTQHGSYAGATMVTTGTGTARAGGTSQTLYYANGSPATAEYDVQVDLVATATVDTVDIIGLAGRVDTAANTFYRVEMLPAGGFAGVELFKKVAGASTSLGSTFTTWNASQTVVQKLGIRNATKKVYIGGVELLSSTDNAITAAGKAGIYCDMNTGATNTTGEHFDNFTADDPAGAAAASTPFTSSSRRAVRGLYLR